MSAMDSDIASRFARVKAEWATLQMRALPDTSRFARVKAEADAIVAAGRWVSGPADVLSVLGKKRDELAHSRMVAWLVTPTGRHGLGPSFLRAVLDHVWPAEALLHSGFVSVQLEVTRSAVDDIGDAREARADIVLEGDGATIVIENKVDAEEGFDQCERLYWSWADQPTETRWLFLSPTGRAPVTATTDIARAAWQCMSYAQLHEALSTAIQEASGDASIGRATVMQYLASLTTTVLR